VEAMYKIATLVILLLGTAQGCFMNVSKTSNYPTLPDDIDIRSSSIASVEKAASDISIQRALDDRYSVKVVEEMHRRDGFLLSRQHSVPSDLTHEVVIAVKQRNLDVLEDQLLRRSTPGSELYQHWLTHDEIGELVANHEGADAVLRWLAQHPQVTAVEVTPHRDFIHATAPVAQWERLLSTKFHVFEDTAVGASADESLTVPRPSGTHNNPLYIRAERWSHEHYSRYVLFHSRLHY
jgi:Pro-kumamolisin, activation domain